MCVSLFSLFLSSEVLTRARCNCRAIAYRVHKGFRHRDVALSAGVQQMVRSDLGAAGVIFTLDTESGFRDVVFVTSSYGVGETIVQVT